MPNEISDYKKLACVFTSWWHGLQSLEEETGNQIWIGQGQAIKAPDRKALAELRRIGVVEGSGSTVVDVGSAIGIPAFRQLIGRSNGLTFRDGSRVRRWLDDRTLEPFAIAACALDARISCNSLSAHIAIGRCVANLLNHALSRRQSRGAACAKEIGIDRLEQFGRNGHRRAFATRAGRANQQREQPGVVRDVPKMPRRPAAD